MNRSAVITGAAGGIGAAFARQLAARGFRPVLIDIRPEPLDEMAADIRAAHGIESETIVADLSSRDEVERVASRIEAIDDLEMLVNNAGFGYQGMFVDTAPEKHLEIIDVNVIASVRFCRAALPAMTARGKGSLVNVSSIGGFRPGGEWAAYGAAKRFIMFFSESLEEELEGTGVKIQVLCPGFTRTGFHDASKAPEAKTSIPGVLWMTPDEVAIISLEALSEDRLIVVPGIKSQIHRGLSYLPRVRRVLFAVLNKAGL
ncbi:MAG: SDR family NAD(P)-dependent oxidoreductase [Myxococcota bacterium]